MKKFQPHPSNRSSSNANTKRKRPQLLFQVPFWRQKYPLNKCPMYRCVCQHVTTFGNYFKAMFNQQIVKMLDKTQSATIDFIDHGVSTYHLAASVAAVRYNTQFENRRASHSAVVLLQFTGNDIG